MKDRIFKTFSGYIVLILIPLGVLLYQGIVSLRAYKEQVDQNLLAEMARLGRDLKSDLARQWDIFRETEELRAFYDYLPVALVAESEVVSAGKAVQRSPLYGSFHPLVRTREGENQVRQALASDPDIIFSASIVGYFQFFPAEKRFVTPYDTNQAFEVEANRSEAVADFHRFLIDHIQPWLQQFLAAPREKPVETTRKLNSARIKPSSMMLMEELRRLRDINPPGVLPPDAFRHPARNKRPPEVEVKYHEAVAFSFHHDEGEFVVGLRPVVLGESLVLQGFVFNLVWFIQEAQSYLEPLQPEFGSIVIRKINPIDQMTLNEPFQSLSIGFKASEENRHIQNFVEERNRFWISILCLFVALGLSLFHLGKIIRAQAFLNRKKNDFISAITHELKAPLTSIIMYTEMLCEGWAKGKEETYYRYIHCESERLSRLIKNVLDYSGIERGVFMLKKGHLQLDQFLEETLEPLRLWIENNGIELEVEVKAKPTIAFDKDSLAQVIYNLCDNVVKYGKATLHPPKLKILIDVEDGHPVLTFYDNGPGVPKEDETKIFKRFYRCENELTRESTGTGLGLSLVKELVEGNGGSVRLYHPSDGLGFGVEVIFPKIHDQPNVA